MRAHLIMEETSEGLLALHNHDELKFVDSLGDVMYVTAGSWVAMYGPEIPALTIPNAIKVPNFHKLVHWFLDNVGRMNLHLASARGHNWPGKVVRDLISCSVEMCAQAGYDPIAVFDAIADSNDTKWYKEENGQRVKDKGPDFRVPDLSPILRGW